MVSSDWDLVNSGCLFNTHEHVFRKQLEIQPQTLEGVCRFADRCLDVMVQVRVKTMCVCAHTCICAQRGRYHPERMCQVRRKLVQNGYPKKSPHFCGSRRSGGAGEC